MQPDNRNPNNRQSNRQNNRQDNNDQQPQPSPPDWQRWMLPVALLFVLIWLVLGTGDLLGGGSSGQEIPYSIVRDNIARIQAISIQTTGDAAQGVFRNSVTIDDTSITRFNVVLPPGGAEELTSLLQENNPDALVAAVPPPEVPFLVQNLFLWLPLILIIGFFFWMTRRAQGQMNGVFGFGRSQAREYDPDLPKVTFDDVAGQDSAKRDLVEVVDFLKDPDKYISLGARIPRGVLLVGPPGTGKTLMARAVAGEANVAFYSIAASEFVEMFVGVGASRVRDLFNKAKDNSPSIVFIDEIDAVGRQRGAGLGGGNDEREQTLNQLLAEMDGFDQSATVIVMAATNRPDVLDPALLRPGRFDRQVTVDLPDRQGRLEILKIHTRGKPLAEDVELSSLAGATVGFSGADIANLANEAALKAARDNKRRIEQRDFSYAFERIILGNERPPLSNMEERQVVAYHEAGHAIVSAFTPKSNPVLKITITPRGQALGITAYAPDDDIRNISRGRLEAFIDGALGGRIAEEIVFADITTGAANDLQRVTSIARNMVAQYGMTEAVGPLNFGEDDQQPFLGYSLSQGRKYSEETAAKIDAETRRIVESAYKRTKALLVKHREDLDKVANALLENEVIERDEFLQMLGLKDKKRLDADKLLNKARPDEKHPPSGPTSEERVENSQPQGQAIAPGLQPPLPTRVEEEAESGDSQPVEDSASAAPQEAQMGEERYSQPPKPQTSPEQPKATSPQKPPQKPNQPRLSGPKEANVRRRDRNAPSSHPLYDTMLTPQNGNHKRRDEDENDDENTPDQE